jgi:1,4-dihydroxy-6-naphthoate synthase
MKGIKIGFSPCPNDCFIFDALVHHKIDDKGLAFIPVLEDVETLNQMAFRGELEVTKLSYHALAHVLDKYALLDAGSAPGFGCGPVLISRRDISTADLESGTISVAIPGKFTTANLLLSIAFPLLKNKSEMVFSEIEDAVLSGKVDAGLIIHENRFTYEEKGLKKLIDLGDWWEKTTGSAIPLGGIAIRRDIEKSRREVINYLIRMSVEFAFANPKASTTFVAEHAQAMDPAVRQKHIDLYVNDFSRDLGGRGRSAVNELFSRAIDHKLIGKLSSPIFWNQ